MKRSFILGAACLGMILLGMVSAVSVENPIAVGTGITCEGISYPSIQAAVNAAMPGAVIQIAAGRYEENVVIDKPLTLEGTSEGDAVLHAQNPEHPAVLIQKAGLVTISHLVITGAKIAIQVEGSCVNLHDNTIIVNEIGVQAWNFERSESFLWGNTFSGSIHAQTGQEFTMRGTGLILLGSSSWTIGNNCFQKLATGLLVGGAAHVQVKANEVIRNGDGIIVGANAVGTLANNDIVDNYNNGVILSDAACVELLKNTIHGNGGWGVSLSGSPLCGLNPAFTGEVSGRANHIAENAKGNLCPATYQWPEEFIAP